MVDGFGTGGFGTVEPFGSVGSLAAVIPVPLAIPSAQLGIIEALTGAIGEEDNAIGGFYMTRTTSVVDATDTTIPVETTLGWTSAGMVAIDGIVYYYTGTTATSLTGVAHMAAGVSVAGAIIQHRVDSLVTDLNRDRSALDLVRRSMLVDYAEGQYLSTVGRNLGVDKLPVFNDDDQYREVIKAVAYNPKGTVLGLELVLDAIVGAGNYEIYEDIIVYPNVVFIKLDSSVTLNAVSAGKTFLTGPDYPVTSGSFDTLTLAAEPLAISSVRLLDLGELFDFRAAKPSALTYDYYPGDPSPGAPFTYVGSESESTGVTVVSGLHSHFTVTAPGTASYRMLDTQGARITDQSYTEANMLLSIPTGSVLTAASKEQCTLAIYDGQFRVSVGLDSSRNLGLIDTGAGAFLGSTLQLAFDSWYDVTIKKFADDYVELWIDGLLIDTQDYSAFTFSSALHALDFGIEGTASAGAEVDIKQVGLTIKTNTDYWAIREENTVDLLATAPTRMYLNASGFTLTSDDVDKHVRLYGSTVTNGYGGSNNGRWKIDTFIDGATVDLVGDVRDNALVDSTNPTRITITDDYEAFTYPDDLGKQIVISGSSLGNDGTYIIDTLRNPGTLEDLDSYATQLETKTNVCEVVGATFVSEVELDCQLLPNFVNESNMDWELSDAGSFSSTTVTLRDALWANDLYTEVGVSDVLTGQILDADANNAVIQTTPSVLYEYYPFYLADALGVIKSYLDALTAAGVIPRYEIV